MSLTVTEIDEVFRALGLPTPSPTNVSALTSINGDVQAFGAIISLPEVQTIDVPIVQMFELATGHNALPSTFTNIASAGMTQPELASALVSSQTFADNYNGGALVNPNAPVSAGLVDALFLDDLGHAPTAATESGFDGMTNAQAFLAFSLSPTITAAHASDVNTALNLYVGLAAGVPISEDPGVQETPLVGQADHVAA